MSKNTDLHEDKELLATASFSYYSDNSYTTALTVNDGKEISYLVKQDNLYMHLTGAFADLALALIARFIEIKKRVDREENEKH